MSKIEELKQLMSIEGCNTAPDIKRHFDHIAKLLFGSKKCNTKLLWRNISKKEFY